MKPNGLRSALAEGRPAVGHMLLGFGTRGFAKMPRLAVWISY